ncbi:hypothetical protein MTO96_038153 [Rhipicephalus appendiculatus]
MDAMVNSLCNYPCDSLKKVSIVNVFDVHSMRDAAAVKMLTRWGLQELKTGVDSVTRHTPQLLNRTLADATSKTCQRGIILEKLQHVLVYESHLELCTVQCAGWWNDIHVIILRGYAQYAITKVFVVPPVTLSDHTTTAL